MNLVLNYFSILLVVFVSMALIFVYGFAFKNWLDKQSPLVQKLLIPVWWVLLAIGAPTDVLLNWLLTPVFWDMPRHPLEFVTARMHRYKKELSLLNWRNKFAYWLCKHLSRHDEGHC